MINTILVLLSALFTLLINKVNVGNNLIFKMVALNKDWPYSLIDIERWLVSLHHHITTNVLILSSLNLDDCYILCFRGSVKGHNTFCNV